MTTRIHRYLLIPGTWTTLALAGILLNGVGQLDRRSPDAGLLLTFAFISLPLTLLWSTVRLVILLKDRPTLHARRGYLVCHITALLAVAVVVLLRMSQT